MTFASRGVSVPFTTPVLAGARLRQARLRQAELGQASVRQAELGQAGNQDIELVLPNPFGGRGIYVLPWSGVRALGKPTVHDTALFRHCLRLQAVDPAGIRDAALDVAREGHAGRGAEAAATATIAQDRGLRARTHTALMLRLIEQVDPDFPPAPSVAEQAAHLNRRTCLVLDRIAPSLGCQPAELATALTALASALSPIGSVAGDRDARIPRLLCRLEETQAGLTDWLRADPGNDMGGLGQAISAAIGRICETGSAVLESTRTALAQPVTILKRWIADRNGVLAQVTRCDWLLDGWERVGLLWLCAATEAARRAALLEMAPLVPVLPREVLQWTDTAIAADAMQPACLVTSSQDSWRTGGAAFALIARNERLLAMSG
jgi:hypothetical protein